MRLNTLAPRPGAKHRVKRLGCGESSGHGKTSGKGHKGQNARSGGSIRIGFEGGQMPMHRRLPKKGFNNSAFAYRWAEVNVSALEEVFEEGATINEESLRETKLVKGGRWDGIKILGNGDLTKKFTVVADRVSASAKEKIEKAGGTYTAKPKKTAAQA
ncbi:MAG: ribosomal protein [Labilithrix sp.]|nr:ribosomal protein [Labilithrix sp.]